MALTTKDMDLQHVIGDNLVLLTPDNFTKVLSDRGKKYVCYQHKSLAIRIHESWKLNDRGLPVPDGFCYVEINAGNNWGWRTLGERHKDYCFDVETGLNVILKYF